EHLKSVYWSHVRNNYLLCTSYGRLTSQFLDFKWYPYFEPFLDLISDQLSKSLYVRFRYGCLPLKSFTSPWCSTSLTDQCPSCNGSAETVVHFMFICPAYGLARRKWLRP
ncbi:hypothetical protein NDU88_002683, partial [Pleurodeles waltl]